MKPRSFSHSLSENSLPVSIWVLKLLRFWHRITVVRTLILEFTQGRFSLLSTLLPNGISCLSSSIFIVYYCIFSFCFSLIFWLKFPVFLFDCVWSSGLANTNYTQLTELYSKYKDRGEIVIVVFLSLSLNSIYVMMPQ